MSKYPEILPYQLIVAPVHALYNETRQLVGCAAQLGMQKPPSEQGDVTF